jgi:hypothetical protein
LPTRASTALHEEPTLFDSIVSATGIDDVFSMQCCQWDGSTPASGALVLGGVDKALYSGKISYTPITHEEYYCVGLESVGTDDPSGKTVYTPATGEIGSGNCQAIIDSGTSELLLSQANYDAVVAVMPKGYDAACITDISGYPTIEITLGGIEKPLGILPEHYMQPLDAGSSCRFFTVASIGPMTFTDPKAPQNVLGQVVMEQYYTVFDKGNSRVGFATIDGCESNGSSAASESPSVSALFSSGDSGSTTVSEGAGLSSAEVAGIVLSAAVGSIAIIFAISRAMTQKREIPDLAVQLATDEEFSYL